MLELFATAIGLALLSDSTETSTVFVPPSPENGDLVLHPISEWGCAISAEYGARWYPRAMGELGWMFLDPRHKEAILADHLSTAEPWTDDYEWRPEWIEPEVFWDEDIEMYIEEDTGEEHEEPPAIWDNIYLVFQASTWPTFDIFPKLETWDERTGPGLESLLSGDHPEAARYTARSQNGKWIYINRVLPRGSELDIYQFRENSGNPWSDFIEGSVAFDAPVIIPVVYEQSSGQRHPTLWMSHTPFEVLSQKPAADRAKGKTIVAGLGLGWLLARVANNPNVTEVILVERDPELVDWILPRLCSLLPKDKPIHVVLGDMYDVLPRLSADTALLDIWPSYGEVEEEVRELMAKSPDIALWWAWGRDWEPEYLSQSESFIRKHGINRSHEILRGISKQ